ncbi:MAG TPA: magnesium-translocating P-type ATPase [Gemmatimonadales bacterium]|nr:magnesium-translocating P-type ATPase [Gemmatimonadales bacterium]
MTTAPVRAPALASSPAAGAGRWDAARLQEAARVQRDDALRLCSSAPEGLTQADAERRLEIYGPNEIATQGPVGWPFRLLHTLRNPLVILLAILASVSVATGDVRAATVMTLMIVLGVGLRFTQEARADASAAALRAMIRVTATALRDGRPREVPLREIVPGDVIVLTAGDMIPADVRLLTAKDLFVSQSSLTGESLPVEKGETLLGVPDRAPLECPNLCFLGTSVQSGTGTAVVVETGARTLFGAMARSIARAAPETAFDRGIHGFTWLMIRFIAVMVPLVFLINGLTKHNWHEAFFFALAVAVGLTPEMLPMIVSVCLSKGAMAMSRKRVIVKRLNAIQNFGAMDVLCTDKTGTLTMDTVILERHCDVQGNESDRVLIDAMLISHLQTGLKSTLDRAILQHQERHPEVSLDGYRKVDEMPFDFSRKIMSIVVDEPDGRRRLLAKGAPEEILRRCATFEAEGERFPAPLGFREDLREQCDALSAEGFRVLAVAYADVPPKPAYGKEDECDLVLIGYVAFLDPPKETAAAAIAALREHGVGIKILTGDNELVTRTICKHVGLKRKRVLLGAQVARLSDARLADAVERTTIFARLSPTDKERIIHALQARRHVVGFLGDGINDAAALRAADVGISVDTAVDVAKESADIILLEKSLLILEEGVLEGRKVFSNVLKYIRMGASSNFGNMFSVLGASALLPFVPMAPLQVLTNNLLYDFSQVPIPADNVDPEQIGRPRPWDIGEIARFILAIGPISSIFDYTTYAVMYFWFGANTPAQAALFQTGWFVESLMTQTLIIHVIRTNKIPFLQSRPSWPLVATTLGVMGIGLWLPVSPLAAALGFVPLPGLYWPILGLTLLCYLVLTQIVKHVLLRRRGI